MSTRNKEDKLKIYQNLFTGLTNVYGTYDPTTGRASQVKAPVIEQVLLDHLTGKKPYGVYLLVKDRTRAIAVDFDTQNKMPPIEFVNRCKHYKLSAYIEPSKSKGYHVWIFFNEKGVLAAKARLIVRHILDEIEQPDTEVFPKQDALTANVRYGNFINAPLFKPLVKKGKTLFVAPETFKPYPNQWGFLESVKKHTESVLDDIIEANDLSVKSVNEPVKNKTQTKGLNSYSLPPCARIILQDGVLKNQRCICFRLAVHLKRLGLPYDVAVAALKVWALKNRPKDGKQVITKREIIEQTSYVFNKDYRGYGCNSEAMIPFCQPDCPVIKKKIN